MNQSTFAAGQTLTAAAGVENPGLPGAADFYLGVLRPDGLVVFLNGAGGFDGVRDVSDLASFPSVAAIAPFSFP